VAGSGASGFALRFVAGRFKGGEFPLRPNREIVVGRGSEFDMVLDEDMVSRRHAKIVTMHGQIVLQDLKSTNGTFVNGERVSVSRLKLGDKVLIGTSIMELVEVDRSIPGLQPTREQASARAVPPPAEAAARTEFAMPALKLGVPAQASAAKSTIVPALSGVSPAPAPQAPPEPAPAPRDGTQGMSGRFPDDDVSPPDLLELFHANRRTGVLVVESAEGGEARLYLRDGTLYHVTLRAPRSAQPLAIDSTKALFRVLTWPSGEFRFDPRMALVQVEQPLPLGTREAVVESLRQWDELRKYEAHLPARDQQLGLKRPLQPRLASLSAEALDTLQLVINLGEVGPVLDQSTASDLETFQDLLYLLQNGYVTVT